MRRVHRGVVADLGIDQVGRVLVGIRVAQVVGRGGDDLGLEHVVDERQALLRIRRLLEQHHVLQPHWRTFARDAVAQLAAVAGILRAELGLEHTAGPAQYYADITVGQVGDEPRRVEVADMRAQLE
ncbi:hypothetical protein D3C79_901470 [compost metagenome]